MKKLFVIIAILAMVSLFAFAQKSDADIYGTVLLPDGSAIPGVALTLTGDRIGQKTVVTSEEGNFRFLKLPPGNYELKFELEGFKTVIRKNIRLYVGKNITLNIPMETTIIKEEIIITERPGAIDVRKTQVGINITDEMIKSLPTARNPWTVMNLVPGMMMDREDVGGAESGQQSSYFGHGGDPDDSTWTVDGANITDPSAIGAAPAYLNINSYEELQVTIGSTDITAQTGGVQLNFVSKRAGNRFSGDFHLYVEDVAWEMSQDLPEYYVDQGWQSPGINRLYQYGVNFGGPIIKNKWWFFGSWGVQDIHARTLVGDEDATWLVSGYGKTNFQLGNTSGEFHVSYDGKMKWGRTVLSRAQQNSGSLMDQVGPGYVWIAQLQHVMGNLMLNGRFCYTNGGFTLDPRGGELMDNEFNGDLINAGGEWTWIHVPRFYLDNLYHYITDRNTINLSLDGNYFMENVLGGDHEIRFGVDYYTGDTTSASYLPNNRIAFTYLESAPSVYQAVWLIPNMKLDVTFNRISLYLSDTAQFGKLTVNLGARYDKESGRINETINPAFTWYEPGSPYHGTNPFPTLLGEMRQVAQDSPMVYEVISPRLSMSYDITGNGKNVLKLTAARYGSQSGNSLTTRYAYNPREIDLYWYDDGDWVPEYEEINFGYTLWTNTNAVDYSTGLVKNQVDPNFNSPLLDELSLTFEKALGEDIAVSVSGFYKKRHNLTRSIGVMSTGQLETEVNNWYYAGDYTFLDGSTAPYFLRNEQPSEWYWTNFDSDTYQRYMAMVLQFSKKFSDKWMFDASFTYSDWKVFYKEEEYDYQWFNTTNSDHGAGDLTNYNYFNETINAPAVAGSSGLSGIFVNARWQVKASGLYQLPWGLNITGVLQAREGYVLPYHESLYRSGIGWTNMYKSGEKFGDNRLPTFWMLSLGVEKTFKISETATATIFVDGYNITNNNTTLLVETDYSADNFDQPLRILNPGIFQFGVRVSF
jgi:hypothetical protein